MEESNIKKTKKNENEDTAREIMEEAAEKLATILIAQIEFNENKDKNAYDEKRK